MFLFILTIYFFAFWSRLTIGALKSLSASLPCELSRGQPSLIVFSLENGSHFLGSFYMEKSCTVSWILWKLYCEDSRFCYDHLTVFFFFNLETNFLKSYVSSTSSHFSEAVCSLPYTCIVQGSTQNLGILIPGSLLSEICSSISISSGCPRHCHLFLQARIIQICSKSLPLHIIPQWW